jgi:hypothetical protein
MQKMYFRSYWIAVFLGVLSTSAMALASDEPQVLKAVEAYMQGLKFNDVGALKVAFTPDAMLMFVRKDGTLAQLGQEQWYQGFAANAGKEEQVDLKIIAVDTNGNAASVKVSEEYTTSVYTNYLSLLKINGEWKIVNKIYVATRK